MEIVLNDLSLNGQFENFESFEAYFENTLNCILKIITEKNIPLYKMADLLQREVVEGMTLYKILSYRTNNTIATIFKQRISQIMGNPYLEDSILTSKQSKYEYPTKADEPNCFTEAIERKCPMLSFPEKQFEEDVFSCKKNDVLIELSNIRNSQKLLDCYLSEGLNDIEYIFSNYPFSKKVVLAKKNSRCYFEQAILENDLVLEDVRKIICQIPLLIEDKEKGRKTERWEHIKGQVYEYRVIVSENRKFRVFFLWQENIIFLNGFIKKRQTTPLEEKKKAFTIASAFLG